MRNNGLLSKVLRAARTEGMQCFMSEKAALASSLTQMTNLISLMNEKNKSLENKLNMMMTFFYENSGHSNVIVVDSLFVLKQIAENINDSNNFDSTQKNRALALVILIDQKIIDSGVSVSNGASYAKKNIRNVNGSLYSLGKGPSDSIIKSPTSPGLFSAESPTDPLQKFRETFPAGIFK